MERGRSHLSSCPRFFLSDHVLHFLQSSTRSAALLHNDRAGLHRQAIQPLKKIADIDIGKVTAHQQDVVLYQI